MRWSGLAGFCILSLASHSLVGCDDSEDAVHSSGGSHSGGNPSSSAGKNGGGDAGKASGGNPASGGTFSVSGSAGTFSTAGTAENGGAGGDATAGTAGSGGTGAPPNCTTNSQCADLNDCTSDSCEDGECVHTNNALACDDGNACTSDDACKDGACTGTNNTVVCDDLSSCTTNDKCGAGQCGGTKDLQACPSCSDASNMLQNCDFSDGTNHWLEGWFGGAGTQQVVNQRLIVDITAGGVNTYDVQPRQEMLSLKQGMKYRLRMVVGSSVNRQIVVAATQAATPFTVHSKGIPPADGFVLDLTKQMQLFDREFTMTDPDDNNVKLELKLGGAAGNPSTVYFDDMYLAEEKCTGNAACDDGNVCTDDACDLATGICSSTNNSVACADDVNSCTTDVCAAGACAHTAFADDTACAPDADACTADICANGTCTHPFDGNVCACQQNVQCDDHEPCTDDICNAGNCEYVNNTAVCDDGKVCTSSDVCAAGVCGGTANTAACDDGNVCTIADTCDSKLCAPGTNVCFDCTGGGNLLTNCDLSGGATGWLPGFFNGGAGTQSVQNGMLVVNITNGGTDGYMVQPRQEGLVLVQNTTYVVKFNAMASIARGIALSMTQNGGGFASYSGEQTFNLTTQMQAFSFEFTMADAPPADLVKFEFRLGGAANNPAANTVYLDNLSIAPKP